MAASSVRRRSKPGAHAYISPAGPEQEVAALFVGSNLETIATRRAGRRGVRRQGLLPAWTKGATALLAAVRALAQSEGVEAALLAE